MAWVTSVTEEIAEEVLQRLASGESLRAICRTEGFPSAQSILRLVESDEQFAEQYARARSFGYLQLADEIIDIADECDVAPVTGADGETQEVRVDATAVARNRLRVDTRKWMLSKMLPKVYGDKLDLAHSGYIANAKELSEAELVSIASAGSK